MTREEKIKKLEEVSKTLKNSFVGLDGIIDNIIKTISPWYITPEIINRPIVVSLWGMTGTGKSSVVKKLIELLDLKEKTITFDCGRESEGSNYGDTLTDKITGVVGGDEETSMQTANDLVFIFDEFQYARTISEDGTELVKSSLRPVWSIIDDGELTVYESRYSTTHLLGFIEDAIDFLGSIGNRKVKLNNGYFIDSKDISDLEDSSFGYLYFNTHKDLRAPYSDENEEEEGDKKKKYRYCLKDVLCYNSRKIILRKLNQVSEGLGEKTLYNIVNSSTLNEAVEILRGITKYIIATRTLDLSKSLVFIIGNLDEAFREHSNLDHDGDADTFAEITNKVSVTEIKEALKTRFRAEQIARLGNNLIKYPTLRKSHFEEIIRIETGRVLGEFKATTGFDVSLDKNFYGLIYSEGVCPTQGVRPVFTTIGMILTPLLSDVIILNPGKQTITIKVDAEAEKVGYSTDSCDIIFYMSDKEVHRKTINLQLGSLRKPKNRKTRFICSTHEAGHAIIMAWCTGKLPSKIISVDSSGGGTCYTFDKERHNEIPTRQDIVNEIMISLGGYTAEEIIYGKNSKQLLLGSSNDIETAFEVAKDAIYKNGLFAPYRFADTNITKNGEGLPVGIDCEGNTISSVLLGGADRKYYVKTSVEVLISELRSTVIKVLSGEERLLAKVSLRLADTGTMTSKEFEEYISKYATAQFIENMNRSIEEQSYQWYENKLKETLGN